jgi:hypothetical protein
MADARPAPLETMPAADAVDALRARLRGPLLHPSDDGYDAARAVWNASIDRRPALVARCAGAADVVAAVTFAREHGLVLSVKGGGHNVAGTAVCDRGLLLDLSAMKGIRIDPLGRAARAVAAAPPPPGRPPRPALLGEIGHPPLPPDRCPPASSPA